MNGNAKYAIIRHKWKLSAFDLLTLQKESQHIYGSHFVERAPMTKGEMEEEVNQLCSIWNPIFLRRIVHNIFEEIPRSPIFFEFPAAKRHHHAVVDPKFPYSFDVTPYKAIATPIYTNQPFVIIFRCDFILVKTMELTGAIGTEY